MSSTPCTVCQGTGGQAETETTPDGVTRSTWISCRACLGTGTSH
ncbi:hypothetical protein [Streptomyces chumphonensis]